MPAEWTTDGLDIICDGSLKAVAESDQDAIDILARLNAAEALAVALERYLLIAHTCHFCSSELMPAPGLPHCEDCPSECEDHGAEDAVQESSPSEMRAALAKWRAIASGAKEGGGNG